MDGATDARLRPQDRAWLRRRVRHWFRSHGRDFPWRKSSDPYQVLIAELLLQRTRADLVPTAFGRFIARFPNPQTLAQAEEVEVMELLRPLGFTHRSGRLPGLGRDLCARFGGVVPTTVGELVSLPGVGRYVANAVVLVAFSKRAPLLDPNVIRLLDRCFAIRSERSRPREDCRLWQIVAELVPTREPRPVALGLVDLGAVVCRPRRPRCRECPLRTRCRAFQAGLVDSA